MGKITKLIEKNPVLGAAPNEIYPVTSTEAVYNKENKSVDDIVDDINIDLKGKLDTPWFTPDSNLSILPDGVILKLGFNVEVDKTAKYHIEDLGEWEPGRGILYVVGTNGETFSLEGPIVEGPTLVSDTRLTGYVDFSKLDKYYSHIPVYINPYCTWDTPISTFNNFSAKVDSTINNEELDGYNIFSVWDKVDTYASSFIKDIRIFNYNPDQNPFLYLRQFKNGNTITLTFQIVNATKVAFSGTFAKSDTSKIITVPLYGKDDCEGDIIYLTLDSGSENITKIGGYNRIYKSNIKDIEDTTLIESTLPIKRVVENLHSNVKDLYSNIFNQYTYGVDSMDRIEDLKSSPLVFYKIFRKVWRKYTPETIPYTVLDFRTAIINGPFDDEIIFTDRSSPTESYQPSISIIPTYGINTITFTGPKGTFYIEVDCSALVEATRNGPLEGNYEIEFSNLPTIKNDKIYDKVESLILKEKAPIPDSTFRNSLPSSFYNKLMTLSDTLDIVIAGGRNSAHANCSYIPEYIAQHLPPGMLKYDWYYWFYKYVVKNKPQIDRLDSYNTSFFKKIVSKNNESIITFSNDADLAGETLLSLEFDTSKYTMMSIVYCSRNESVEARGASLRVIEGSNKLQVSRDSMDSWTEANGYSLRQNQSFPTYDMIYRRFYIRRDPSASSTTYHIEIAKDAEGHFNMWGTEKWRGNTILMSNISGQNIMDNNENAGVLDILNENKCSLLIYEAPMYGDLNIAVNNEGIMSYTDLKSVLFAGNYNTDYSSSSRLAPLDPSACNCPIILVIPQYDSTYFEGNNYKNYSGSEDGKGSWALTHNELSRLFHKYKTPEDFRIIDLTSAFINEGIRMGYSIEDTLKNKLATNGVINDEGAKIWAKYLSGAFLYNNYESD